jgi:uncharacterized protein (DUF2062 family)
VHSLSYAASVVFIWRVAALSPLLGAQMALVGLWWWLVHRYRARWDFNLVAALAWTWTTNVVTAPPLYYLYVMTGRLLLGRWERLTRYEEFAGGIRPHVPADATAGSAGWGQVFLEHYALALFVGSLPWMIAVSGIGYWISLRWLEARYRRRHPGAPLPPP